MAKSTKKMTKVVSLKRKAQEEAEVGDLKRFAGSSDEDYDDDDDEVISDDAIEETVHNTRMGHFVVNEGESEEDDGNNDDGDDEYNGIVNENKMPYDGDDADVEVEDSEVDEDDADDHERVVAAQKKEEASGMANAMIRILGTQPKKGLSSVVLSKTITPLQRLQKEEKERLVAAKEKRKANRDRNLMALHIPLSVATSSATNTSTGLVQELELERAHRRVATRGVVALFNAIAQHQNDGKGTGTEASTGASKDSKEVKKMTKHGFLDMIKSTAKESTAPSLTTEANKNGTSKTRGSKPNWNALQDDYLLGTKMKDWDRQSSSSSEEEADYDAVDDTWGDDNPPGNTTGSAVHGSKAPDSKKAKRESSRTRVVQ